MLRGEGAIDISRDGAPDRIAIHGPWGRKHPGYLREKSNIERELDKGGQNGAPRPKPLQAKLESLWGRGGKLTFFGRALKGNVELLMRKLLMNTESCVFHLMCPTPSVLFPQYAYCRCRVPGHFYHPLM